MAVLKRPPSGAMANLLVVTLVKGKVVGTQLLLTPQQISNACQLGKAHFVEAPMCSLGSLRKQAL